VAWGLKGLGYDPLFISRVGDDKNGREILRSMQKFGLDTKGVQIDDTLPTGSVSVKIQNGEPVYTIEPNQAYDKIDADEVLAAIEDDNFLLYHGTLAVRDDKSKVALQQLQEKAQTIFVDINLREPWFNPPAVTQVVRRSNIVKLNNGELFLLTGSCPMKGDDLAGLALFFAESTDTYELVLTMGSDGALLIRDKKVFKAEPEQAGKIADTVGAGDAFSAGYIAGLIEGRGAEARLKKGSMLASAVCTICGATNGDPGFYRSAIR
jgi:fructokinase